MPLFLASGNKQSKHKQTMASASSTSARTLFIDSKLRLADRVQVNVNNIASVARQINRGSKSSETLFHTAKNMALQEHAMENTEENLKKLQQNMTLLNQQFESIQRNALLLDEVKEQVRAMQR
ncbi:BLOC-1-related complex subunit 7 [Frankliniella occidentalis]|uniref:BLOC-1-related complex subunit 7 n=1 Tax=Frankliniella occidentalis TaxID=133901 RepID=A0A6J1TV13_FRAOC|nr:BLOC-1-related complex subunit 7 [Frankliniella occidentalis]